MKSVGITYSTSAMGGDHTAGFVLVPEQSDEEAVYFSQEAQINHALCDSAGFCIFQQPTLDEIRHFYGRYIGREVTREEIADLGWQCLTDEWAFNDQAGFGKDDDNLPECIRNEGIGPDNKLVFRVAPEVIAQAKVRQPARESMFNTGKI